MKANDFLQSQMEVEQAKLHINLKLVVGKFLHRVGEWVKKDLERCHHIEREIQNRKDGINGLRSRRDPYSNC